MDRVLRFYWGGPISSMSENRRNCYRSIFKNSRIKNIEVITPDNFRTYEVAEHPIHPAFEYLSQVHQSDYMRVYVTYFHGGGWTDVKYCDSNWNQYFDLLEQNPNKDGIGHREMIIANGEYRTHNDNHPAAWCLAMSSFIFVPRSVIFKDYLTMMENILSNKLDQLKQYPGHVHPMVCVDNHQHYTHFPEELRDYKYPLRWMEISECFFTAQVPYLEKVMYGMPPAHNFMTGHNHR